MKRTTLIASLAAVTVIGLGGFAIASNHGHMNHGNHGQMDHSQMGHGAHGQDRSDLPASTRAYMDANDAMHTDMMIEFTGDADVDFIAGMIPHHEGAIVMAEIVLEHGSDPEVADLARAIIAAQAEEIAWMRAWLAARGQ